MTHFRLTNISTIIVCILATMILTILAPGCNPTEPELDTTNDEELVEISFVFQLSNDANDIPPMTTNPNNINKHFISMSVNDYSDASYINRYIIALYDEKGNQLTELIDKNGDLVQTNDHGQIVINSPSYSVHVPSLRLIRGKVYQVVVWAQYNSTYNTDDLKKVEITYSTSNNNEYRDAFTASEIFTTVKNETRTITLTRPFAQVNLLIKNYTDKSKQSSALTAKECATEFNALTQVASSNNLTTATFTHASLPSGNNENFYLNNEQYRWVSMDYVLVPENNNGLELTFELKYDEEVTNGTMHYTKGLSVDGDNNNGPAPASRNYQTNIILIEVSTMVEIGSSSEDDV